MTQTWSNWHTNPFHAIKECAEANGTPGDFDKAKTALVESIGMWKAITPATYLNDVLEEVFDATQIVVETEHSTADGIRFRAAYESIEIKVGTTYIGDVDHKRGLGSHRTVFAYDKADGLVSIRNEVGKNPPAAYVELATMSVADFMDWAKRVQRKKDDATQPA